MPTLMLSPFAQFIIRRQITVKSDTKAFLSYIVDSFEKQQQQKRRQQQQQQQQQQHLFYYIHLLNVLKLRVKFLNYLFKVGKKKIECHKLSLALTTSTIWLCRLFNAKTYKY